jgi:phosphate transport system substrate-binding protein
MHRFVFAACLAILAEPWSAAAQVVYGGSSTILDTVLNGGVIQGFESRTGVKVQVADKSGTGQGLKLLADGKINLAGAGRTVSREERKAGLIGTIVAYDGLAVFVNRQNPVKALTSGQLKEIFTGRATSWKQLGGADLPIVPIVEPRAKQAATSKLVQEMVLEHGQFAPGFREIDQLKDQLLEVARNERAVCIVSVGLLSSLPAGARGNVSVVTVDSVKPSGEDIRSGAYLLSRPMLLVTKGTPAGDVKKLLDFVLSKDGQAIVERYFVTVKS